jgi:putative nucleotidyltransferase with HDIG domain
MEKQTAKPVKINKEKLEDLKIWFSDYVRSFKDDSEPELLEKINFKELHTIRVCEAILDIGKSLELDKYGLRLAEIIALFHDVGRFEQYKTYKTFVDSKSVNHAELGVEILQKYRVLNNLNNDTKCLIFKTIKYHNRAVLSENETGKHVFFTKLVRDADKLDIYRVVTEYYNEQKIGTQKKWMELDLPNTPEVSKNIIKALLNKNSVDFKDVKNLNDLKLLQLGWVFDVNFPLTLQNIKSKHYIKIISKSLPETKQTRKIFDTIHLHLENIFMNG